MTCRAGVRREKEAASVSDVARVLPWDRRQFPDEAELVSELQDGSEAAFDWLITHYHGPVYSLVYGMLADSADAADITQDVFLKAYKGIRGFRRGSQLKTWLYRIAVREALNHRRWTWRHRRQQTSIDAPPEEQSPALNLEDLAATPFEQMASKEMQTVVRGALAEIPEAFRSAVILRDLEGLSYEEVAEVLDISVGTVKSRILRGRRALRVQLEPLFDAHGEQRSRGVTSSYRKMPPPTQLQFAPVPVEAGTERPAVRTPWRGLPWGGAK